MPHEYARQSFRRSFRACIHDKAEARETSWPMIARVRLGALLEQALDALERTSSAFPASTSNLKT
jgi:hypothetical protein